MPGTSHMQCNTIRVGGCGGRRGLLALARGERVPRMRYGVVDTGAREVALVSIGYVGAEVVSWIGSGVALVRR